MHPTIQISQNRAGLAEAEVASPAKQVAAKFADHTLQGRASIAFGDFANTFLELRLRLRSDRDLTLTVNVNPRNLRFQGRSTALLSG